MSTAHPTDRRVVGCNLTKNENTEGRFIINEQNKASAQSVDARENLTDPKHLMHLTKGVASVLAHGRQLCRRFTYSSSPLKFKYLERSDAVYASIAKIGKIPVFFKYNLSRL
jgi:hypothetical protein